MVNHRIEGWIGSIELSKILGVSRSTIEKWVVNDCSIFENKKVVYRNHPVTAWNKESIDSKFREWGVDSIDGLISTKEAAYCVGCCSSEFRRRLKRRNVDLKAVCFIRDDEQGHKFFIRKEFDKVIGNLGSVTEK